MGGRQVGAGVLNPVHVLGKSKRGSRDLSEPDKKQLVLKATEATIKIEMVISAV